MRWIVPFIDLDPIHVRQAKTAQNSLLRRIFLVQIIVKRGNAARATARIRLRLQHDVVKNDLVCVQIFHADFQNAFEVIAIGRFVRTGVVPVSLETVRHPMVVLVALLPVLRLGQFVIQRFGEHRPTDVKSHLDAVPVEFIGDAFGLLHRRPFVFEAESLVKINHRVAHTGIGHALLHLPGETRWRRMFHEVH